MDGTARIRRQSLRFVICASLLLLTTHVSSVLADNDFVETYWRVDDFSLYKGANYFVSLAPNQYVSSDDPYASGWLALNFSPYPSNALFSQVGLVEQNGAFRFFIYSEAGVICMNSARPQGDGRTCNGQINYEVGYLQTNIVQMLRAPDGYWYIYLYYPNGSCTYCYSQELIGSLFTQSQYIYRAFIDSESASNTSSYALAGFIFSHPKYVPFGQSSPLDWQGSGATSCPASIPIFDTNLPVDCLYNQWC